MKTDSPGKAKMEVKSFKASMSLKKKAQVSYAVTYTCNPNIWETGAKKLPQSQGKLGLHGKF